MGNSLLQDGKLIVWDAFTTNKVSEISNTQMSRNSTPISRFMLLSVDINIKRIFVCKSLMEAGLSGVLSLSASKN